MEKVSGDMIGAPVSREPAIGSVQLLRTQEEIWRAWPYVAAWLAGALARSMQHEIPLSRVEEGLRDGTYCMLVARDAVGQYRAALVLQMGVNPRHERYLAAVACGGVHVEAWLPDMARAVSDLARHIEADQVVAMGRPGWARMLRRFGVKLAAVVVSWEPDALAADVTRH